MAGFAPKVLPLRWVRQEFTLECVLQDRGLPKILSRGFGCCPHRTRRTASALRLRNATTARGAASSVPGVGTRPTSAPLNHRVDALSTRWAEDPNISRSA